MRRLLLALTTIANLQSPSSAATEVRGALDGVRLGLDHGGDYRLTEGQCADCGVAPQALWYFRGETIAVPARAPCGFDPKLTAQQDVRAWVRAYPSGDNSKPPLVWLGAPQVSANLKLVDQGRALAAADGSRLPFTVVPKLPTHPSYYDASSAQHFAGRALRLRGRMEAGSFVARTIWPQDYALDFGKLPYQPLAAGETLGSLVRESDGGAKQPPAARVLWQRDPQAARDWAGKPVLAIMLNGAQGDDDEAHGGHFAVVTGAFGPRGEWDDWLVNNFYNLGAVSEKGIVAATLPMDNYLADLNSGQAWYRPSYMLVAVLRDARAASLAQQALSRVFNHFYRQDFEYRHATDNCTGISMETLRSLGWNIPQLGATSRAKAVAALPYVTLKEQSLAEGRKAYDYLVTEQTNLFPFAAFEAAGRDLLERVVGGRADAGGLEGMLAADIEALVYLRIPQFPSSRAFGAAPVDSIDEYNQRVPADKADWKIIPVAPRPFPPELKDASAPAQAPLPSLYALYGYAAALAGLGALLAWRWLCT